MAENSFRPISAARSIAHTTAALVGSDDLADILAHLLDDCAQTLDADAAGVMLRLPDNSIEVLSATTHQALQLELYQGQVDDGPCLDSISTGQSVSASTAAEIRQRWPRFATALAAAGLNSLYAQPMIWQGHTIGGLNLFRRTETPLTADEQLLAHAFSDMATITVIHTGHVTIQDALARTQTALASRNIIEQAKGVLAYRDNLDMAAAYQHLRRLALETNRGLSHTAADLLKQTSRR